MREISRQDADLVVADLLEREKCLQRELFALRATIARVSLMLRDQEERRPTAPRDWKKEVESWGK
ncbi:hypothetical protein TRIP_B350387 [uncultured Desulfatiglans sp.]|nr:hypothetical protein TRIP_B350387 [uncultured Desulfatiglans sp.]